MDCPNCGNRNREGARFCDSCGFDLTAAAPPAAEPSAGNGDPSVGAEQLDVLAPPSPAGAPTSIEGRYTVQRFLGRGGRKDVYLARDSQLDRDVAVALFETEGLGEAAKARARREMQAMDRLGDDPHLVTILDTGESDGGGPTSSASTCPAATCSGLLAASPDGRLEVGQAIGIGIDVCRALEHAHGCGIVHRDLKPANVWLAEDGSARLGDFGLADDRRRSAPPVGTGRNGRVPAARAGARALLRSRAPTSTRLARCSTRWSPDSRHSAAATRSRSSASHLNADPVAPSRHNPAVPGALDELILELLAKSPERAAGGRRCRFASALEEIRDAPPEAPQDASGQQSNPLESLAGGVFVGRESELGQLRGAARRGPCRPRAAGDARRRAGHRQDPDRRGAGDLRTGARRQGLLGPLPRGRGRPGLLALGAGDPLLRARRRPGRARLGDGSGAADIARVVPEVAERIGEVERGRGRRGRGGSVPALRLDRRASCRAPRASRPLVLVLDDLHWADEPSLLLLQFLARELGDSRLLISGPTATSSSAATTRSPRFSASSPARGRAPRCPSRSRARPRSALHRDHRRRRAAAGPCPRRARSDRGQPVLRRRGGAPARR